MHAFKASLLHAAAVMSAQAEGLPRVLIVEEDVAFTNDAWPDRELAQFARLVGREAEWKVIRLAYDYERRKASHSSASWCSCRREGARWCSMERAGWAISFSFSVMFNMLNILHCHQTFWCSSLFCRRFP